jgi:hypothetical protein
LLTCSTEIQGNAVCNSHSSQNNLPITDWYFMTTDADD